MQIISTGPASSQDVQNVPCAGAKKAGASDPVDPAFDLLLGQFFTSVLQTGQQTPPDASTVDEGTNSGGEVSEQPQAQNASQKPPADTSKLFLGVQSQDKTTAGSENPLSAQFAEALKNIKGNEEGRDPGQKAKETKVPSLDKNAKPVKNDHDDIRNIFSVPEKSGKRDMPLVQDAAGLNVQAEKDEGRPKTDVTPPTPVKTDFTVLVQQSQSSSQHQAPPDAAVKTTDGGAVPVAVRPHGNDPADLFDHAVSIAKDGNRLAVQLDHDGLGKLDINLSLDKGSVNAQINVADDAAKKLIENNMQQIVNSLLGDGVSISGFSVSLKQQGTWDGATPYRRDEAEEKSGPVLQPVSGANTSAAQGLVNIFI